MVSNLGELEHLHGKAISDGATSIQGFIEYLSSLAMLTYKRTGKYGIICGGLDGAFVNLKRKNLSLFLLLRFETEKERVGGGWEMRKPNANSLLWWDTREIGKEGTWLEEKTMAWGGLYRGKRPTENRENLLENGSTAKANRRSFRNPRGYDDYLSGLHRLASLGCYITWKSL